MNKAVLIGHLTRDVELRHTNTGRSVAQFTIAINRPYTKEDGQKEADFINIIAWDKVGENTAKYCKKGSHVAVEGRIQIRSYDNTEGKKVYVTEVIAQNVQFLESKKDDSNFNNLEEPPIQNKTSYKTDEIDNYPMENDPFSNFNESVSISNDDLPF